MPCRGLGTHSPGDPPPPPHVPFTCSTPLGAPATPLGGRTGDTARVPAPLGDSHPPCPGPAFPLGGFPPAPQEGLCGCPPPLPSTAHNGRSVHNPAGMRGPPHPPRGAAAAKRPPDPHRRQHPRHPNMAPPPHTSPQAAQGPLPHLEFSMGRKAQFCREGLREPLVGMGGGVAPTPCHRRVGPL